MIIRWSLDGVPNDPWINSYILLARLDLCVNVDAALMKSQMLISMEGLNPPP
jgi:hypothetical protein